MKNKTVLIFSFAALLGFSNCNSGDSQKKETVQGKDTVQNQLTNEQITRIQNSIDSLVITLSGGGIPIEKDTSASVVRLDTLPEKDREAALIKYRLTAIEKSLANINLASSNSIKVNALNTDCKFVWECVQVYCCKSGDTGTGGTPKCLEQCCVYDWVWRCP